MKNSVLMINGQNHKGNTYTVGRMLAEKITDKDNIDEVFLPRDLNHFCNGCYKCIQDEKKCPYFEEKNRIEEMMRKADILIFTTPTYCMEMSAPMKTFLDLFYQMWIIHRPRGYMFHKKAVVISTAAGSGTSKAIAPIIRNLAWCGVPCRMKYGIAVSASKWDEVSDKKRKKITKDMEKMARRVKKAKPGKPGFVIRFMFNMMANLKKNAKEDAYDINEAIYWKENGWFDGRRPWKDK